MDDMSLDEFYEWYDIALEVIEKNNKQNSD